MNCELNYSKREFLDLLEALHRGDERAAIDFVCRWKPTITSVIRSYHRNSADVDDLVQETFLVVFRDLNQEKHLKTPIESFAAWIRQVTKTTIYRRRRDATRKKRQAVSFFREQQDASPWERGVNEFVLMSDVPDARAQHESTVDCLEMIESIRVQQDARGREIFDSLFVEGQSQQATADHLEIHERTVRRRAGDMRSQLRALLEA